MGIRGATSNYMGLVWGVWDQINRLPKNPFGLSFRGVPQARDGEESRTALVILRSRFVAEFTLSDELRRFFASLRMTASRLGMTVWKAFSAAR